MRLSVHGMVWRSGQIRESSQRAQPQPFVIGSATELFEPLPKLGAFGLLAVCDDLFGCPAGAIFCRCLFQTQFGRF